jgi:hypothetical protein
MDRIGPRLAVDTCGCLERDFGQIFPRVRGQDAAPVNEPPVSRPSHLVSLKTRPEAVHVFVDVLTLIALSIVPCPNLQASTPCHRLGLLWATPETQADVCRHGGPGCDNRRQVTWSQRLIPSLRPHKREHCKPTPVISRIVASPMF